MGSLDMCLKATGRPSPIDCDLAASMRPGLSQSAIGYAGPHLKKGQGVQRRRPVTQSMDDGGHKKGRRLGAEEAQAALREFAIVLLSKYDNVQQAFKAFDIN